MPLLSQASDALDRICRWGALAAMVLMVVFIAVQVIARYLWADPPGWTEEAARYAMVWAGLLGATVSFRAGFDPVLAKFKVFVLIETLVLVVIAAEAIGMPMVWFTIALPIAIVVIFIHLLADIAGRKPAEQP